MIHLVYINNYLYFTYEQEIKLVVLKKIYLYTKVKKQLIIDIMFYSMNILNGYKFVLMTYFLNFILIIFFVIRKIFDFVLQYFLLKILLFYLVRFLFNCFI